MYNADRWKLRLSCSSVEELCEWTKMWQLRLQMRRADARDARGDDADTNDSTDDDEDDDDDDDDHDDDDDNDVNDDAAADAADTLPIATMRCNPS